MGDPSHDDLWRTRLRLDAATGPDPGRVAAGVPAFAGRVLSTGTLAVGNFVRVGRVDVTGTEADGSPGVASATGGEVIALPVGPGVPATGDLVVVRRVDHRWVFDKHVAGTGPTGIYGKIPNCFCTQIPATLRMTSADPSCNYRMFQSCTIQWQPTPAWAATLNLGPNIFLSTESFPDPIAGGDEFFYYLICHLNQFWLTRLYPVSPYGSPFRDAILYVWNLGGYGNTCDPFHLDNGTAFPGSDLSCSVFIDPA